MNKIYFVTASVFMLFSCGTTVNYLGSSSTPTQNVDVFVDASAIKKQYTIIGKGYVEYAVGSPRGKIERMQAKAIGKAKQKGADAILFQDYYITENGADVFRVSSSDSTGKVLGTAKNASVRPVVSSQQDILFLKYTE